MAQHTAVTSEVEMETGLRVRPHREEVLGGPRRRLLQLALRLLRRVRREAEPPVASALPRILQSLKLGATPAPSL